MGIPKMFRFLTDRYPLIMQRLDEDHHFDHFYLDMNGIIHQCTHPSDNEIAIEDIEEMFARIFQYTERLFRIVAPTTLMLLAVDGVAPRAKMNQQRSRRFRSAKDAERAMADAIASGIEIPSGTPFDSNCITPGTKFMYDLSERFREWIDMKMRTDPAWQQGCTVVFSGSEVPGEGEHKIMDYIRKWRSSERHSPNIRHCMYGLDADLMMLGLVAHAPHFTLIREKMRFSKSGRKVPVMRGTVKDAEEFELLEIAMLRDMLFLEFKRGDDDDPLLRPGRQSRRSMTKEYNSLLESLRADDDLDSDDEESKEKAPAFNYDSRRIVDDFVFMCMLVGNDFLPNIPHLDISDGAINLMFRIYKRMLPKWGGYLTDRHRIHPDRVESFLSKIALTESHYFSHRAYTDGVFEYKTPAYRKKYYNLKFDFDPDSPEGEEKLLQLRTIYMEGLHWVLQYYHNGVSSWNWFYPDFYAVLASDMTNLRSLKIMFQKGHPFKPLTQLMAVLPPESANFLPEPMRDLMINPNSPVVDFYPLDFDTDPNGKRQPWEAVVVVPFIDEKRLLGEVNKIDKEKELSDSELRRDQLGPENWFHASKYPKAKARTYAVRPSKYSIPYSDRSRNSSPTNSRGTPSRSRTPSPSSRDGRSRSSSPPSNRSREQPGSQRPSGRQDSSPTSRTPRRTGPRSPNSSSDSGKPEGRGGRRTPSSETGNRNGNAQRTESKNNSNAAQSKDSAPRQRDGPPPGKKEVPEVSDGEAGEL